MIVGAIGIVIADAMLGEITPRMAAAVAQSGAKRILLPVSHCDNIVAGVQDQTVARLVDAAVQELEKLQAGSCPGA